MKITKKNSMNFLIIDCALDKIHFFLQFNSNTYNKSFQSTKINYEKLSILLFEFLRENNINLDKLTNILVNQGPGNFSGIRASIALAKGLSIANKIDLYGFSSNNFESKDYEYVISLYKKGILKKNLIKPIYMG